MAIQNGNFTQCPLSHTSGDWLATAKKARFWSDRISPGAHQPENNSGPCKKLTEGADLPGEDSTDPFIIYISSCNSVPASAATLLFFALPSDSAIPLSSSQLNPIPCSALTPLCCPFPLPKSNQLFTSQNQELDDFPKPASQI